jgi:colanic acid biosynthesis glycosyl transferase WcaI
MKLLISSMTFAPDHSGIALYATDFAVYAAEQGHEVTVVTGFSWYPKWEKRPEDKRKLTLIKESRFYVGTYTYQKR